MSSLASRCRAYVELSRLSNAPTVISNVLTGVAIGLVSSASGGAFVWQVSLLFGGVLLMYISGMALNDWMDAAFDREHAPSRPIPSGRISRGGALVFAAATMLFGLLLIGLVSMDALLLAGILVALILLYNRLHKQHAASVLLMGLCRGMVYVIAAAASTTGEIDWSVAHPLAAGLTLYVTLLTVIARGEHAAGSRRPAWSGAFLAAVVLAPLIVIDVQRPAWLASAAALFVIWVVMAGFLLGRDPPQIRATVLRWLAGICLVDVVYLAALQAPVFASIALGCFVLTVLAHRRIPGT